LLDISTKGNDAKIGVANGSRLAAALEPESKSGQSSEIQAPSSKNLQTALQLRFSSFPSFASVQLGFASTRHVGQNTDALEGHYPLLACSGCDLIREKKLPHAPKIGGSLFNRMRV
jgi:hypothetical protein